MSFLRYESCKNTRVEWLPEVPAHWTMKRLKHVCSVTPSNVDKKSYDDEVPVRLCNYTDVYYNETITADLDFMVATASSDQIEKFSLKAGQTIITKDSETADDIAIAAYVPEDLPGIVCGYHLSIVEPKSGTSGAFIKHLFGSWFAKAYFAVRANGLTRVGLSQYALDNLELPFPPIGEQTAIVTFLDHETAKIDALVEEQQRLIGLLKEKRQAIISRAVTKGLDPNVPMRDTGVEWLGEVPQHWTPIQLGRLCRQVSDGPHFSPKYVDEGVMFLSARNVKVDGWSLDNAKFISEEDCAEFDRRVIPERGDILYTKGGTTGIARVVDLGQRFQVWVHIAVLKIDLAATNPYYLAYALNSFGCYEQSQLYTQGATNNDLGLTRLIKIWLALPPFDEQGKIATYLKKETERLDELIRVAEQGIELLRERRAALISAAVTGKIDVRELVEADAPLLDVVAA